MLLCSTEDFCIVPDWEDGGQDSVGFQGLNNVILRAYKEAIELLMNAMENRSADIILSLSKKMSEMKLEPFKNKTDQDIIMCDLRLLLQHAHGIINNIKREVEITQQESGVETVKLEELKEKTKSVSHPMEDVAQKINYQGYINNISH